MRKGSIPTAKKPKKSLLCALDRRKNTPLWCIFCFMTACKDSNMKMAPAVKSKSTTEGCLGGRREGDRNGRADLDL